MSYIEDYAYFFKIMESNVEATNARCKTRRDCSSKHRGFSPDATESNAECFAAQVPHRGTVAH